MQADLRPLSPILRSADDVIAAVRSRKEELGLSDALLEDLAGFCPGTAAKYLAPGRTKMPGLAILTLLMGALGCGLVLVDDPSAARMQSRWTRRSERHVQPPEKVARIAITRARPLVLSEGARKAAAARWKGATKEQRQAVGAMLVEARVNKRARTCEAA
jgi:hypothetical protein